MEEELAHKAVNIALALGCSYSEARIHEIQQIAYVLNNGQPLPPTSVMYGGVGIRFVYSGVLGFTYSNAIEESSIREAIESAVKFAANSLKALGGKTELSNESVVSAYWLTDERKKFEDVSHDDLKSLAEDYDGIIRQESLIKERSITVLRRGFFSLEGAVDLKFWINLV